MTTRLGIVADDFTGLQAVAAEFAKLGIQVRTFLDAAALARADLGDAMVFGVDANSRALGANEAAAAVRAALASLEVHRPAYILKQTDSALQGHVVPETLEALRVGEGRILFAVACPSLGRLTVAGRLVCKNAQPLGSQRDIAVLFRGLPGLGTALIGGGARSGKDEDRAQILIGNAETDSDLDELVAIATKKRIRLFVGSVGLAQALGRMLRDTTKPRPVLLVIGSLQQGTRIQLSHLLRTGMCEEIALSDSDHPDATARRIAAGLADGKSVALTLFSGLAAGEAEHAYPLILPESLSHRENLSRSILRTVVGDVLPRVSGIVIAGGRTANLVLREVLCLRETDRIEHLFDGMVAARGLRDDGGHVWAVTKAGNWGPPEALETAMNWLRAKATMEDRTQEMS